jgi:hypothetical protein
MDNRGMQWEAVNVKRPSSAYVEKNDKVSKAQKALSLAQLVLSAIVLYKKFKKK